MHTIGFRYSLLSVIGAGVFAALPILGVMAVTSQELAGLDLPDPSAAGDDELAPALLPPDPRLDRGAAPLLTDARLVPAFEGGRVVGLKIFSVRAGTLPAAIGLENGDVIQRINGHELTSPAAGLELHASLQEASTLRVDILRRGVPGTLTHALD
jgi:hypothetical protein